MYDAVGCEQDSAVRTVDDLYTLEFGRRYLVFRPLSMAGMIITVINNYSPKWRWLAVDIYPSREAAR